MNSFENTALDAEAVGQIGGELQSNIANRKPIAEKSARQANRKSKTTNRMSVVTSATAGNAANITENTSKPPQHSEDALKSAGEASRNAKTTAPVPRQSIASPVDASSASVEVKTKGDLPSTPIPVLSGEQATYVSQPNECAPAHNSALADGVDQLCGETQSEGASTEIIDSQILIETHGSCAVIGNDEGLGRTATQSSPADIVAQLIQLTRMRRRWHKAEKSLTLQAKAMARAWFGGDIDEANRAFALLEKGEAIDPALSMAMTPFLMAREPFEVERKAIEKTMRKLARQLPVWGWAEDVKGLGDLRLAIIVGECGDVGAYKSVSAVWKRMGLAVINGGRQRRVSGDEALEHGYNPERRAVAYVMGTEILKQQVRNIKDDDGKRTDESRAIGPYGEIYLARKAYEAEREGITKAHANNRAARYMVKRVFRDLYSAWRQA